MLRLLFCWLTNRQPQVIAAGPVPETERRKLAGAERKARGQKARDRYAEIAAALKAEAGVREHTEHNKLSGRAYLATGHSLAPAGVTRRQLYVVAHECAHFAGQQRRASHISCLVAHSDEVGGAIAGPARKLRLTR